MNTPISDFIKKYNDSGSTRLHMPGHKGKNSLNQWDITEIDGADSLFYPNGIIRESEENASKLFGTYKTCYSTEGSSLCIKAMLQLAKMYKNTEGRGYVIAGRNAHTAFISASILADFDIKWIYPKSDKSYLSCEINPSELDSILSKANKLPFAVYVTSPDYLGNISDIEGIAKVCKKHNVILIVDNAHGAYLKFTEKSQHPIDLGADMCCDSAHKTLPVLTGGAYLHISKNAPLFFNEHVKSTMCLYGSTSPSYLILDSLDKANAYIDSGAYKNQLLEVTKLTNQLKKRLEGCGYSFIGDEKAKITIDAKKYGYQGDLLSSLLIKESIIPEFYDKDIVVLMVSSENTKLELEKLENALLSIPKKDAISKQAFTYTPLTQKMSTRDGFTSEKVLIGVDNSLGCVFASQSISCPPAVSIAVSGEVINESTIELFKYYGVEKIYIKN